MLDLTDIATQALALVAAGILGTIAVVARAAPGMVLDWIGLKQSESRARIEATARVAVEGALKSGAAIAIQKAKEAISGADGQGKILVKVDNEFLKVGADYVVAAVPAKLRDLGISPESVKGKVEAWVARALNLPAETPAPTSTTNVYAPTTVEAPKE